MRPLETVENVIQDKYGKKLVDDEAIRDRWAYDKGQVAYSKKQVDDEAIRTGENMIYDKHGQILVDDEAIGVRWKYDDD